MALGHIKHFLYENAQIASLLLLISLFVLFAKSDRFSKAASSKWAARAAVVLGVASLCGLAIGVACYVLYPNYFDHFEAVTAAISVKVLGGATPYPDVAVGDVYEAPYGPLLFLVTGTFIKFSPTIAGSKISGVLSFLAAIALLFRLIARTSKSLPKALVFLGISSALFLYMRVDGTYVYWNRSEPFLLLIAIVSLFFYDRPSRIRAAFILGVLAGCASGFKLHGALYVLPAALGALGGAQTWRRRVELAAIIVMTAVAIMLLPFARPNGLAMLGGYVSVISMTSRHGLLGDLLISNLILSATVLAPSAFLIAMGAKASRQTAWILSGVVASLVIASLIGSKAGAGMHHLLPLVPVALYIYVKLEDENKSMLDAREYFGVIAMLSMALLYPYIFTGMRRATTDIGRVLADGEEYRKLSELIDISDRYRDAQVGVSDEQRFADSYYRAVPVMRGGPYVIDFSSWADFKEAGYTGGHLTSLVSSCRPRAWILPKGDPFSISSPFTDETLLTEAFRKAFHSSYRKVEERRYFDVWVCKTS